MNWKRVLFTVLGIVLLVAGGGLGFLVLRKPAVVAAANIRVEATPARLERGKYLFETLADCAGCHSGRDFTRFAAPVPDSGWGKGFVFPAELGFPGQVTAPNITPDPETGIGKWTDGEKIRAIREGVSRDGHALFPLMPYEYFRNMSDEDVHAVVAYMNTLPPLKSSPPPTKIDFPVNLLIKSVPQPAGSVTPPPRTDAVKYGEYVANMAGCAECHTPMERGQRVAAMRLAGGREFRVGAFLVASANITPDPETGIGQWTEARFVAKFKDYEAMAKGEVPPATQANFTLMPWLSFSGIAEADLRALYAYLKTQKPIQNKVDPHAPPPGS